MNKKTFKGRIEPFANRLQIAMELKAMKKAELSRLTGINQQRIGQYVRGTYEARQSALYALANALCVNPAWLAGYDVPMQPQTVKSKTPNVANEYLKLALFGTAKVDDCLLDDVKNIAKAYLQLKTKKPRK